MYFLHVEYTYPDSSNLFKLEDDYKDDKPISLNTFVNRITKDLDGWRVRIQIANYSHRLYCFIDRGTVIIDSLGKTKDLLINNITKVKGCFIDKTCIITLSVDGAITGIYSRLCDCIGSSRYDEDDVKHIRSYIRQLPFVKYSFGLLEEMFLTDLEAHIGNIDYTRRWYIDDCSFVIESVNEDKLDNESLHLSIDTILALPNYRNVFESNVKLINDKEIYIVIFKLP